MNAETTRTALVLGGTGLIGGHLLRILAGEPRWSSVTTLTRRPLPTSGTDPAIREVVTDLSRMAEHAHEFAVDRVFVCLGTTMRAAGSKEAFRAVDLLLVQEAARLAAAEGAGGLLLVSSQGADPASRVFYLRTKGEAEEAASSAGLPQTTVLRPTLLIGDRSDARPLEGMTGRVLGSLSPLLVGPFRRFRPISGRDVARAMAVLALGEDRGTRVLESDEIAEMAAAWKGDPRDQS